MAAKKKTKRESSALVIRQVELSAAQQELLQTQTPDIFIKERPIRGGKTARYVEIGYVVAQLNKIFGVPNWQFEIVKEGETERKLTKNTDGEVWCLGRLTIIDHKNGYRVSKEQYGQHPSYPKIPLGDTKKAAASDALKKCASAFGIALDVYWQQLDENGNEKSAKEKKQEKKATEQDLFEKAKKMIAKNQNISVLRQIHGRMKESKLYTPAHKDELVKLIEWQIKKLEQ